jgi:hypothetical protein
MNRYVGFLVLVCFFACVAVGQEMPVVSLVKRAGGLQVSGFGQLSRSATVILSKLNVGAVALEIRVPISGTVPLVLNRRRKVLPLSEVQAGVFRVRQNLRPGTYHVIATGGTTRHAARGTLWGSRRIRVCRRSRRRWKPPTIKNFELRSIDSGETVRTLNPVPGRVVRLNRDELSATELDAVGSFGTTATKITLRKLDSDLDSFSLVDNGEQEPEYIEVDTLPMEDLREGSYEVGGIAYQNEIHGEHESFFVDIVGDTKGAPTIAPTAAATVTPTALPPGVPEYIISVTPAITPTAIPTPTSTAAPITDVADVENEGAGMSVPAVADQNSENLRMMYSVWRENMIVAAEAVCASLKQNLSFDQALSATYYDGQRVFLKIAELTGDKRWEECAESAEKIYRDSYVVPNGGQVPGYWAFSDGLLSDYLINGDIRSRDALIRLSERAAFHSDVTPLNATVDAELQREVAYAIKNLLNAERIGIDVGARLRVLVDHALGHLEQQFGENGVGAKPFMVGLAAEALIAFEERHSDPRILPALSEALERMWKTSWLPEQQAFVYDDRAVSVSSQGAVDLNLLIAPAYAWVYHRTGSMDFQDRADQIFEGGVTGAYLGRGKQFNQNYRWSHQYLVWRGLEF